MGGSPLTSKYYSDCVHQSFRSWVNKTCQRSQNFPLTLIKAQCATLQKSLYSEGRTDFREAVFSRHNRTDTPKKSQKLYQQQEESTSWGWRDDSVGKVLAVQSRWHELRTQNSQKTRHSRKSIYNPHAAPLGDERHRQQKRREVDQQPVKMRNTTY